MKLDNNEKVLIGGKPGVGKTKFIVNEVNNSQYDNKVLFLSLDVSKDNLMYDYKLEESNNLTIISDEVNKEELVKLLDDNYDYIYVDYLEIVKSDILDFLINSNTRLLVTSSIKKDESISKYDSDMYNGFTSIYELTDKNIKKFYPKSWK